MSQLISTYKTIESISYAEFRDKGSKFLTHAYPLNHPDEVKDIINELRKEHPKAVHNCYAYRIGVDGLNYRANDDGEPSGSAGKPILGQIDSFGVTNILVVVTRYFGGTLLGVPGLINAYKTSTQLVLEAATFVEKTIHQSFKIQFSYPIMNDVMTFIKRNKITIEQQEMNLDCVFTLSVPINEFEDIIQKTKDFYGITLIED